MRVLCQNYTLRRSRPSKLKPMKICSSLLDAVVQRSAMGVKSTRSMWSMSAMLGSLMRLDCNRPAPIPRAKICKYCGPVCGCSVQRASGEGDISATLQPLRTHYRCANRRQQTSSAGQSTKYPIHLSWGRSSLQVGKLLVLDWKKRYSRPILLAQATVQRALPNLAGALVLSGDMHLASSNPCSRPLRCMKYSTPKIGDDSQIAMP